MKPLNDEFKEIVDALRMHIEIERLAGGEELLLASPVRHLPGHVRVSNGARGAEESPLESLKKETLSCEKCELCRTRRNVVFGAGSPKAKLMFVGEAPGMEEDLQGVPFVGRAGSLLTKIIESIGLKRKDIYIANVLKCRPPKNRNPLPTEILTCEEYLRKQIEIIRPAVICALGKFAAQTLLRSTESITRLRGRFYDFQGTKLIPTFHPAYLLRNPHDKRLVWEDMKKIRKVLRGA